MTEAMIQMPQLAEMTPRAEFTLITPAWCSDLLENHNPNNRLLQKHVVNRYSRSIREGHWPVTGQPIILDWNGDLIDGQHRCAAVVDSDTPIFVLVVTGIDPGVMPAVDRNAPRRTRDTLRWANLSKPGDRSAVLKPLWGLENGFGLTNRKKVATLDDFTLLAVERRFAEVLDVALPIADRLYRSRGLGKKSWGVAVTWMLHQGADRQLVLEFAEGVETGVSLSAEDPRYQLRNWCDRARGIGGPRRSLRDDEVFIAVVKAWNSWVTGKTVKQFAIKPSEPIPAVEAGA